MQFQGFDWLSGHGILAIIPCPKIATIKLAFGCFCFVLAAFGFWLTKRNQEDLAIFFVCF